MSYIASLRSSDFQALGDDALKDEDNVSFLAKLPLTQQADWLLRLRWLRIADRLAENELLEPSYQRFASFCADWRCFIERREIAGEHEATWREMRFVWFTAAGEPKEPLAIAAWGEYLDALRDYAPGRASLATLHDHDLMLMRLSGSLFSTFPYLLDSQRKAIARFGMLDQMMNNLRDVSEDLAHGLCYFPDDILAGFGVRSDALITGEAIGTPGFNALSRFWIDDYLPRIREGANAFLAIDDLHPSLIQMRDAFLRRYERIERVFRECEFDYLAFPATYWSTVREERALPLAKSSGR